jgi:alkanesulfonate monooxygenase SsuD/methylene tetrahydromethanopterin reductase-like flavin-dependent oxidoreductase (luciferase family)
MADATGFDGVTLSEHHAGFPGYLPVPLSMAAVLGRELDRAWSIACPTLLPLRRAMLVAEHLAWLAALEPRAVGAGFVPGYQRPDFDAVGVSFETRGDYWRRLQEVCALLRGQGGGKTDAALAACRDAPVPVVSGAAGRHGAERAARAGAGLLIMASAGVKDARELVSRHAAAGGPAAYVLIRRVWVGRTTQGRYSSLAREYQQAAPDAAWLASRTAEQVVGSADEVAETLASAIEASGATSLNLRVHAPGVGPDETAAQIEALGADVLPSVRAHLGWQVRT